MFFAEFHETQFGIFSCDFFRNDSQKSVYSFHYGFYAAFQNEIASMWFDDAFWQSIVILIKVQINSGENDGRLFSKILQDLCR